MAVQVDVDADAFSIAHDAAAAAKKARQTCQAAHATARQETEQAQHVGLQLQGVHVETGQWHGRPSTVSTAVLMPYLRRHMSAAITALLDLLTCVLSLVPGARTYMLRLV